MASTHPTATAEAKINHWIAYDRCGPSLSSGEATGVVEVTVRLGGLARATRLSGSDGSDQPNLSVGCDRSLVVEGEESAVDENRSTVIQSKRCHHVDAGSAVLTAVGDGDLFVGQVDAFGAERAPFERGGIHVGGVQLGDVEEGHRRPITHLVVEVSSFAHAVELPERQEQHRDDAGQAEQMEEDPLGSQQEPEHEDKVAV